MINEALDEDEENNNDEENETNEELLNIKDGEKPEYKIKICQESLDIIKFAFDILKMFTLFHKDCYPNILGNMAVIIISHLNLQTDKVYDSNNNSQIKKNDSNNNFKEKNKTIDLIKSKDNNLKISHNNNFNISDYIIKKEDDKCINNKNTNVNEDNNKFEDNPQIKKLLSKINESSTIDNEIKFDKNAYKKPEKYYPIKHDKFLNPHINNYNKIISSKNPKLRSYQQVINEKIKITNYNNNPQLTKNTIISKNPKKSYENKLDDFFVNSTINNYKLQQKLNNNINAFYDIGFPEELKAGDFDPKF
jgi:hypothetical protein